MTSPYLLDTHTMVRWIGDARRLSRAQARALDHAVRFRHTIAYSAMTLIEIAMLFGDGLRTGRLRLRMNSDEFFAIIEEHPSLQLLPVSVDVAREAAALAGLRDPGDRIIAATARVHGLRLVTSDQRIIDSGCVPVIE